LQTELEEEQEELRSQIQKEQEMLYEEEAELQAAQKKNERNADSVTGEMFAECQVYIHDSTHTLLSCVAGTASHPGSFMHPHSAVGSMSLKLDLL